MKFRFSLETVLRHREHLEQEAQRVYAEAKKICNEHMARIQKMYQSIDQARIEIEHHARGVGEPQRLEMLDNFIEGQKIRITRARIEARELLAIVEEKHELLLQASRDKQSLVKLKEQHLIAFKKQIKKLETKQLDDIVSTRARRGEQL